MRLKTVVIGLLVVGAALAISGCGRRDVAKLQKEPKVTVVVNQQTGETKTLPIEEYVKGVVGGEMGRLPSASGEIGDWPENAYAAQAILARSFTMEFLSRNPGAEISTNVEKAQAYKPANITPRIENAVRKTRGEVLVDGDKYVTTWFHSYSGGQTATAAEGLNFKEPETYTKSVKLPANEYVPEDRKHWTATYSLGEISQILAAKGVSVGEVKGLEITERGPSGRVTGITIVGSKGTTTMHGADFRLALGAERMRSTLVDEDGLKLADGQITMSGRGFGHGVGMSQWDDYKMAKENKSPEDIVMAFFQNVTIQKRWK